MASEQLDDVEKIVRMTEWNEQEPWECSENEEYSKDNNLAAAKRFMAAQSFLLSWKEGKVPTGWRRARKITDFNGEYPKSVIDSAEDVISERIAAKNMEKTIRLNAAVLSRGESSSEAATKRPPSDVALNKQEIEKLKAEFSTFNLHFFEAKGALSRATTAIADVSFRLQAVSEILE